MGWLISITMLIDGCFSGNEVLVFTSGLFAIAGSIGGAMENLISSIKVVKADPGSDVKQ